jgi:murein DD-endopeptidase MepM/ murein hydrolase activator NlpD
MSVVTSEYGPRTGGTGSFHEGIDFSGGSAAYGAPNKVIGDGTVDTVSSAGAFGEHVIVFHGTIDGHDYYSLYAHMVTGSVGVSVGDPVTKGDTLGQLNSTGSSTGNHLHMEIHECAVGGGIIWNIVDDSNPRTAIDPRDFMTAYGDGGVLTP